MAEAIRVAGAVGEYMDSVTVLEWRAKPGDAVEAGQIVVVFETAKAATEVAASRSGVLTKIFASPGDEVKIGATLGLIGDSAADTTEAGPASEPPRAGAGMAAPRRAAPAGHAARSGRIVASPLARRTARARDVDLRAIRGTGPNGRIKRRDVERAAKGGRPSPSGVPARGQGSLNLLRSGPACDTPVVFIHGFGADTNAWRWTVPHLERDHGIVLVDLPCHGASPAHPINDVIDLAREVSQALRDAGIRAAHLVGHSLGGATALALPELGGVRLASLCLIAPAGLGPDIDGAFVAGFLRATGVESLEPWLRRLVADPARLPPGFAEASMALRADPALRDAQRMLADTLFPDGTQRFDLRGALGRLQVPAKIVWGLADSVIPWRHALASPGHVGLHLLPNVGHLPHLEAPELLARLVRELIRAAA